MSLMAQFKSGFFVKEVSVIPALFNCNSILSSTGSFFSSDCLSLEIKDLLSDQIVSFVKKSSYKN